MGGDSDGTIRAIVYYVSIHAPVWGATRQVQKGLPLPPVSIHAPVWGATIHRGNLRNACEVSIHAPVWGATFSRLKLQPLK